MQWHQQRSITDRAARRVSCTEAFVDFKSDMWLWMTYVFLVANGSALAYDTLTLCRKGLYLSLCAGTLSPYLHATHCCL